MTYHFNKIDHVQLAAPKGGEEQARHFFREILGFIEVEKPEELKKQGGAWFQAGSCQIHIGIEEPFLPAQKAHPALEIYGIAQLKTHLTSHNIEYIEDGRLPGANRIYVNDPFGNRIEIMEWVNF
ncbi:VOC family protein [Mesobacillus harenae]|uniref:VOC family protein n=1 Tax=Mesobacillus harenae TaxID=2213203 RepID=UPI001580D64C|nr:VOC family protein [Mesobacillus harenae]